MPEERLNRFEARLDSIASDVEVLKLTSHVVVGNAADRQFAATLDDHERRIRRLEDR